MLQIDVQKYQPHTHTAHDIHMMGIGTPTYTDLQAMQDTYHSAGVLTPQTYSVLGENITIYEAEGYIRLVDDDIETLYQCKWNQDTFAIPSNTIRYIGIQYISGNAFLYMTTSYNNFNFTTNFPLYIVTNEGGTLYVTNISQRVGNHANYMILLSIGVAQFFRDAVHGGLVLSQSSPRHIIISAGRIFVSLGIIEFSDFDSSVSVFSSYYYDGSTWIKTTGLNQWDNLQYNNIATGLVTLSNSKYGVYYIYIVAGVYVSIVYGQAEYDTVTAAEESSMISTLPPIIESLGYFAGRGIFQKSASTFTSIQTAQISQGMTELNVVSHIDLTNIGTYDHTQIDSHLASTVLHNKTWAVSQSAHGFSVLNAIRHNGTQWTKAQADATSNYAMGVVSSVTDVNNFSITTDGKVAATGHGLTIGSHYYLSSSTPGDLTSTPPTNKNHILSVINANEVLINLYYRIVATVNCVTLATHGAGTPGTWEYVYNNTPAGGTMCVTPYLVIDPFTTVFYITKSITIEGNGATISNSSSHSLGINPADNTGTILIKDLNIIDATGSSTGGIYRTQVTTNKISEDKVIIENCYIHSNDYYGIYVRMGHTTIRNCLVYNNGNAGIYCFFSGWDILIESCTVANNVNAGLQSGGASVSPKLHNTIVYNNTVDDLKTTGAGSSIDSLGYNLIGDVGTANLIGITTGNQLGANPLLLAPANNGGYTYTAALDTGSPARDAGDSALAGSTDARGILRPQGVGVNIGQYED